MAAKRRRKRSLATAQALVQEEGKKPTTVNELLVDAEVRHAALIERLKARMVIDQLDLLEPTFNKVMGRAQKRLEKLASRGVEALDLKKFKLIQTDIGEFLRRGFNKAFTELRGDLDELAVTEAHWQVARMKQVFPINVSLTLPTTETLKAIARKRPFQGRILKEWYQGIHDDTQKRLRDAIRMGVVNGETVPQIMARVRGTRARGFTDGVMHVTRREAEAIVRTSVNHTVTQVREDTYKANEDVVGAVQWVSTLDSRTTIQCAALDGNVFPVGKGPRPPVHWNCRSSTVPVTKSFRELGFDIDEIPPSTRASIDGQVAETTRFGEWLRRQPKATQNAVLGRGRADMWRAGKLGTKDGELDPGKLLDANHRPITLRKLRELEEMGKLEKMGRIGKIDPKTGRRLKKGA